MTIRAKTWKVLHYESSSLRSTDFLSRMSKFTEIFILYLIMINIGLTIAASMQLEEQYTCKQLFFLIPGLINHIMDIISVYLQLVFLSLVLFDGSIYDRVRYPFMELCGRFAVSKAHSW